MANLFLFFLPQISLLVIFRKERGGGVEREGLFLIRHARCVRLTFFASNLIVFLSVLGFPLFNCSDVIFRKRGGRRAVFDTAHQMCVANGLHGAASHNVRWILN